MQSVSTQRSHFPEPWGEPLAIARWYGDPVSDISAHPWLSHIRFARKRAVLEGFPVLDLDLAELAARYWCSEPVANRVQSLLGGVVTDMDRARIELVYGQLLVSRRLSYAHDWLRTGFERAAPLIDSASYLRILRRHERLRALPLSDRPSVPATLDDLLVEADVIARLRGIVPQICVRSNGHMDTLG